jgi:lipopolysaccharide transport system ATP-binding protein
MDLENADNAGCTEPKWGRFETGGKLAMPGTLRRIGGLFGTRTTATPTASLWDRLRRRVSRQSPPPTVFHVTHHKAGSQWIYRILLPLALERVVPPEVENAQFFKKPILPGKVYPTVYVTREQFESVAIPPKSQRFVIIRDLRDTLISMYFSVKHSHPVLHDRIQNRRATLQELSLEDGLLDVLAHQMSGIAQFQWSWLNSGEELIKYEDLLENDEEILERVLRRKCRFDVDPGHFHDIIVSNRFEAKAGRKPGEEDIHSHERKGIAGDWRNYFTPKVTTAFKRAFGSLLIATGYERDFNW